MKKKTIIVIGAGIGGLSTAYQLRKMDYDVEILEASRRHGGRMMTIERKGDLVDVGAQFYHSDFKNAYRLIDEMGLRPTMKKVGGKIRYQLADGSNYDYDNRFVYMKLLKLRGNLRLYRFVVRHIIFGGRFVPYCVTGKIPSSDDMYLLDSFQGEKDRPIRDFLIMPLSAGTTSGPPELMSLYHFICMLRLAVTTKYIGLTGGVASLADALAKELPVRYESPVKTVVMEKGNAVGVQMMDGSVKKAAHVVVALDSASAARVMPDELAAQRRFFEGVMYSPIPMPVFFLDRPLAHDIWCYWNDPSLKRTFKFAMDERAKMPEMCPSGKSVLTAWPIYPRAAELMKRTDDALVKEAREDVELMIPGFSKWIEDVRVVRHPFATEMSPPGFYQRVADFLKDAESLKGISFVNSVFGINSMESSLVSRNEAVGRICRAVTMK